METKKMKRSLTLWSLVLLGLANITPLISLGIFGIISSTSNGVAPTAFAFCAIAMLFTASSYGIMARAYPVSGSSYTYVRKTIDSRVGFMTGWAILLDYFFIPMVIWLIGAAYLHAQFPGVPEWVFLLMFILITTWINVIGIKLAVGINLLLMIYQLLIIGIFVCLTLAHIAGYGGVNAWFSMQPIFNENSSIGAIAAGAALAAYSFIGFDGLTTFSEETIAPKKTMPRAIMICALFCGLVYAVVGYTTQLVHPGGEFVNVDSASFDIAKLIGGQLFASFFLAAVILAQFTSGIACQAGVARLLYAMGRDGVLPKKVFAYLHPKYLTPVAGIVLSGLTGFLALTFNVLAAASFINFGAFVSFTMVNLAVIFYYKNNNKGELSSLTHLVFPFIGVIVNIYLLTKLDSLALILGISWLAIGLGYLTYLSRGFSQEPPEIDFNEEELILAVEEKPIS